MCSVDMSVIYLSPGRPKVSIHQTLMSFHCVSFSAPAPHMIVTGCAYLGSVNVIFPDVGITPGYVAGCIIQVIVLDTKVIAKTLSISYTVQGFPYEISFPLIIICHCDWFANPARTISKGHKLFKHLFPRCCHNTLNNP